MNLVLLLVVVAEVCIGICAWRSPEWLRRAAARLLTRADVIDLVKTEKRRRMQVWMGEFGLADDQRQAGLGATPGAARLRGVEPTVGLALSRSSSSSESRSRVTA